MYKLRRIQNYQFNPICIQNTFKNRLSTTQFNFCKGTDIKDAINMLRIIAERMIKYNKKLVVYFTDYEKV